MITLRMSIIFLLIMISCKKTEITDITDNDSIPIIDNDSIPIGENDSIPIVLDIIRYTTIYFDNQDRIVRSVTTDSNEYIFVETNYYYDDSIVIKWEDLSYIKDSSWYILGQNGFCEYSIDSFYFDNEDTYWIDTFQYYYDNEGYLSELSHSSYKYDNEELIGSHHNYDIKYFYYQNGNLDYVIDNDTYYSFEYYDTINKIDVTQFQYCNGITGKISSNLVKSITSIGLNPRDDRYSVQRFEYALDAYGYVTEKMKKRNSSYDLIKYTYIYNYAP